MLGHCGQLKEQSWRQTCEIVHCTIIVVNEYKGSERRVNEGGKNSNKDVCLINGRDAEAPNLHHNC